MSKAEKSRVRLLSFIYEKLRYSVDLPQNGFVYLIQGQETPSTGSDFHSLAQGKSDVLFQQGYTSTALKNKVALYRQDIFAFVNCRLPNGHISWRTLGGAGWPTGWERPRRDSIPPADARPRRSQPPYAHQQQTPDYQGQQNQGGFLPPPVGYPSPQQQSRPTSPAYAAPFPQSSSTFPTQPYGSLSPVQRPPDQYQPGNPTYGNYPASQNLPGGLSYAQNHLQQTHSQSYDSTTRPPPQGSSSNPYLPEGSMRPISRTVSTPTTSTCSHETPTDSSCEWCSYERLQRARQAQR